MVDVQNLPDDRNIPIKKVGVKNINYPIIVLDRAQQAQSTVAKVSMFADLPHNFKGTHMSRFIEVLNLFHGRIDFRNFLSILDELKMALEAQSTHCEMDFPYFIEKAAPVSGARSMMEYRCRFIGELDGDRKRFFVGIQVPITTLCPCSKEISDGGAHNQRGLVAVTLSFRDFFWMEDVIRLIEGCASSEVFALLKREDEKVVTERAYEKPQFVEDVARDVAAALGRVDNFPWFTVEVENFESIHNHSAYAFVEVGDKEIPQPFDFEASKSSRATTPYPDYFSKGGTQAS